jgi:hypothetical protein
MEMQRNHLALGPINKTNKHSMPIDKQTNSHAEGIFGKKKRSEPPAMNAVIAKRKNLRGWG